MPRISNLLVRCRIMTKPDVGVIHAHSWIWRPNHISKLYYQPAGQETGYELTHAQFEKMAGATSVMQAMAIVRAGDASSETGS